MFGKDKCRILRQIRQQIAEENDIALVTKECTHKGSCRGTCPACEAELRFLEEALARRRALGKKVAVAALATGIIAASGCALTNLAENAIEDYFDNRTTGLYVIESPVELDGEITAYDGPQAEVTPGSESGTGVSGVSE